MAQSTSKPYPAHFSLEAAIRPNILKLTPYRCARDDYSAGVLLDANENALGPSIPPSTLANGHDASPNASADLSLHRYPDRDHVALRTALLRSGSTSELLRFAAVHPFDEEVLRRAVAVAGPTDPDLPAAVAALAVATAEL